MRSAAMARMIAKKVATAVQHRTRTVAARSPVIAANVGAAANGTATKCVQLARLRPVTTYKTINSPAFVLRKMKC